MIVEGDRLVLVMELVEGGDLDTYRRSAGGTLSRGEALGLTAQICDALAAAHAAGIVHRDLKPANVLLDAGQVRLADFGIARIAGESSATTTGMVVGTAGFLAPEVIRGEAPSAACDVYAVGVTLYELLAGMQPFTGQIAAVMHSHLETPPARPGGLPDRLWALISVCLSKDPAARPDAAALARALRDPALRRDPAPRSETSPAAASPPDLTYVPGLAPATESARRPAVAAASGHVPVVAAREAGDIGGAARPGSGRARTRTPWVAAVAFALVFAGIAAGVTYIATSGSPHGKSSPPSPVAAASGSRVAALAGATGRAPSHRAVPSHRAAHGRTATRPSVRPTPSAHASTPAATSSAPSGTPPAAGPYGPNLVADGSFGEPTLSAWNHQVWNTILVSVGRNGGNAAQMTADPTAGLSQIVTGLKPGTLYQLTTWLSSARPVS